MKESVYRNHTWKDIAAMDRAETLVLVPLGATEQHGHHLPLATDALSVEYLAEEIPSLLGEEFPLLVLPTLPIGVSVEHMQYAGSLTLQPETYYAVLKDICESLIHHGFRRIVFLNGHGGNSSAANMCSYEMRAKHGAAVFVIDVSVLLGRDDKPVQVRTAPHCDSHAGELETALVLALRPDLVHMERAGETRPERFLKNQVATHEGPVSVGWLISDLSPRGSCGGSSLATPEQGKTMLAHIAKVACQALREIQAFDPTPSQPE